jgi:hypothetical protein
LIRSCVWMSLSTVKMRWWPRLESVKKWISFDTIINAKNVMNKVSETKSYLLKSLKMTNDVLRKIDAKEMSIDINELQIISQFFCFILEILLKKSFSSLSKRKVLLI